jgi:uncharacterized protein CbrC (UPF0167 family)
MTRLRHRMEADLELRGRSRRTIETYLRCVSEFARHHRRSPDQLGIEEIRAFLLHLAARRLSTSSVAVHAGALAFFYRGTLGRGDIADAIPRPKVQQKLPTVLSREEVQRLDPIAGARDNAGGQVMDPFPYFENPVQPLSSWSAEDAACHFCGAIGPGFDGPFFGPIDVERVCEACLRRGALREAHVTTCTGDVDALRRQLGALHPELPTDAVDELVETRTSALEHCTPRLQSWQDWLWPVHCGEYCRFIEEIGKPEIRKLAANADPEAWFCSAAGAPAHVWRAIRNDSPRTAPESTYDTIVYRFSCRACGSPVLLWDAS